MDWIDGAALRVAPLFSVVVSALRFLCDLLALGASSLGADFVGFLVGAASLAATAGAARARFGAMAVGLSTTHAVGSACQLLAAVDCLRPTRTERNLTMNVRIYVYRIPIGSR